jgi:3-phenylpropionate/trans-cinnamate dioxygenase ferredoxin component
MDELKRAETILVGFIDDLPPGQARVVVGTDPPIAIFNVDGEFFATEDTCTHAKSSLAAEGYIDGDVVECGYHLARFCVRDGRVLTPPASSPLQTYAVSVSDGRIYVRQS